MQDIISLLASPAFICAYVTVSIPVLIVCWLAIRYVEARQRERSSSNGD